VNGHGVRVGALSSAKGCRVEGRSTGIPAAFSHATRRHENDRYQFLAHILPLGALTE
jgi:hypothetical protein